MRMEHHTGPMPPNELAQEAVDAVRNALARHVQRPTDEPAPDLAAALHELARDARQKAVPPEQLLLILKRIWQAIPDAGDIRDQDHTRFLQRVVTMCIKEYFSE